MLGNVPRGPRRRSSRSLHGPLWPRWSPEETWRTGTGGHITHITHHSGTKRLAHFLHTHAHASTCIHTLTQTPMKARPHAACTHARTRMHTDEGTHARDTHKWTKAHTQVHTHAPMHTRTHTCTRCSQISLTLYHFNYGNNKHARPKSPEQRDVMQQHVPFKY